tara:strand:- start:131 stop:1252 length:1122 start_codon:yes stop_codon:yes gene_type:complete
MSDKAPKDIVAGHKATITKANKKNDFQMVIEQAQKILVNFIRLENGEWGHKSGKQPLAKITTPSEIKPTKTKKKTTNTDIYKDEKKRENRIFVAQDFEGLINPVKKALILPAAGLEGVAQFFKLGLFDQNTQLICVDQSKKVVKGWEENFGGKLRLALESHGVFKLTEVCRLTGGMKDPVLIHGKIGAKDENGQWDIDLAGIDGIDFVWLDFTGAMNGEIGEWMYDVLKWKTAAASTVNVTALAKYIGQHGWAKQLLAEKREVIDLLDTHNRVNEVELIKLLSELDPESMETKCMDNILIRQSLEFENPNSHGIWVRRSQDHSLDAEALSEDIDLATYNRGTSGAKTMVTHKFIRGYAENGQECLAEVWPVGT